MILPIYVVVIFIVTPQSNQRAETKSVREENLSDCIDPDLGIEKIDDKMNSLTYSL